LKPFWQSHTFYHKSAYKNLFETEIFKTELTKVTMIINLIVMIVMIIILLGRCNCDKSYMYIIDMYSCCPKVEFCRYAS